jgi:CBS domain-containing protein
MDIPDEILDAADRLKKGAAPIRMIIRDFIGHFGAQRRGAVKVAGIRDVLDFLNLKTEPDFVAGWIDSDILLRLKSLSDDATQSVENSTSKLESNVPTSGYTSAEKYPDGEQGGPAPTSPEPDTPNDSKISQMLDPAYRIGNLPAANKPLVSVNRDDSIDKAMTLMLQNDFSILPVLQGPRIVKGVISWKSIASKTRANPDVNIVSECCEHPIIVSSERTLFDVIPLVMENDYVLVRQLDEKISGIVTASDLSFEFSVLTEPFLLIREIELHLRRVLKGKVTSEDIKNLLNSDIQERQVSEVDGLTFGACVRLLENRSIWEKLNIRVCRVTTTTLLNEIKNIRNDVMHFDPDPMTSSELDTLRRGVRLMQQLYKMYE